MSPSRVCIGLALLGLLSPPGPAQALGRGAFGEQGGSYEKRREESEGVNPDGTRWHQLEVESACYAPPPRYQIGDFTALSLQDLPLLPPESPETLEAYGTKGKPPDRVLDLLSLLGYEGMSSTAIRELALRRLRRHPDAPKELLAVLKDAKAAPRQRGWAAAALGELGNPASVPPLIEALQDAETEVRGFSAMALGRLGTPEAVKAALGAALKADENEDVRGMAILSLAGSGAEGVRPALAGLARNDAKVPVRRAALAALGVKAGKEEAALLEEASGDKDPRVRSMALIGLGLAGQGRETVAKRLHAKLEEDQGVRCHAALALGLLGDEAAAPALVEALDDKIVDVGCMASLSLGRFPAYAKGVDAMAKTFQNAKRHGELRCYALVGLGLTRAGSALPVLEAGAGSKDEVIKAFSATGLGLLGAPQGAKPLLAAVEDKHYEIVRAASAEALGRLKPKEATAKLAAALKDRMPTVREAAALSLSGLGDRSAAPALEKALEDKQEIVRAVSALALDLMEKDGARPLRLCKAVRTDPKGPAGRRVGTSELTGLLGRHMPPGFKLPFSP